MKTRSGLHVFVAPLLAACVAVAAAQQEPSAASPPGQQKAAAAGLKTTPAKLPSNRDRRRAAKLYLEATRLYQNEQFEPALHAYEQAEKLDSTNHDYHLAAEVARSHAVTALLQSAAQNRTRGNLAAARADLTHIQEIDPGNQDAQERLQQIADSVIADHPATSEPLPSPSLGGLEDLDPKPGVRSFHLRTSQRQVIQQVFHAWGIEATIDDSIRGNIVRLDLDDASFTDCMRAISLLTDSFYVPVDAHRAVVARDTREMRQQYMRNGLETVPLSGLTATEMTDMGNLARNVFEIQHASVDPTAATLTLRAPESSLTAFNATYQNLMEGRPEVLIDVRVFQLAHTYARNTGAQPTQQIGVYNVLAEAKSILNANQDLVQQIIASGLAGPNDIATILGLLLASGQIPSSVFSNGLITFGGSCNIQNGGTCSPWAFAASPGTTSINLSLNSSDTRQLDDYRLRLQDNEEGTLKNGTKYPIETSSFSSLSSNTLNIAGLTGAGTSSSLASLLSSLAGATTSIPQFQYQDLGLVMKARPRVLRSGEVALSVDLKITGLTGSSINDVPILTNRSFSGVVTVRADQSVLIASEVDKNEIRAISGLPGMSEIPGLNDVTDKNTQKNYATLLIIMTPRVVRMPHGLGHSPMKLVDRNAQAR